MSKLRVRILGQNPNEYWIKAFDTNSTKVAIDMIADAHDRGLQAILFGPENQILGTSFPLDLS